MQVAGTERRQQPPRRGLPLVPIAPLLVAVLGVAAAVVIAILGISRLAETSDAVSASRARVLATTLAARMRATPAEDRSAVLARAARKTSAELLLVDHNGQTVVDQSYGAMSQDEIVRMLVDEEGGAVSSAGRVKFATAPLTAPLAHLSMIALVEAPATPPGALGMVRAVAVLAALLLTVAVGVAFGFARATQSELVSVRGRIDAMANAEAEPAGKPIPPPSIDQVGELAAAFNLLVTRFAAAERTYRADINQAKRLEQERSAFLAGLSHELRTPLNAILGFAHVLETEVDGPLSDDARESVTVIRTSGEHLRQLIDDILDLSAMETGQLQLVRKGIDVLPVAKQVMREARPLVRDKPVTLSVSGEMDVIAWADRRRLRQILTNLVSNAVKFTSRGAITISVDRRPPNAVIAVTDTGAGISPEQATMVFEEYQQAGDRRMRLAGTGLGLAMARRLAVLHGGTIELQSTLGAGSTFTVKLPLYEPEDETMANPVTHSDLTSVRDPMATPLPETLRFESRSSTIPPERPSELPSPPPPPTDDIAPAGKA